MTKVGPSSGGVGEVRMGFVSLLDAAPLIAAYDLGFFEEEGLRVHLERQLGWGNIRDKLISGHLDVGHSLLGLPLMGALGPKGLDRTVAIMALGTGGSGITLGRTLTQAGVTDAVSLAGWMSRRRGAASRPLFGHVFPVSIHHYLLRRWLSEAEIDPDRDVDLCVLPPQQVGTQLERGHLMGFCSGEPWGTLAEQRGFGRIAAIGHDVAPEHPDKVLSVRRDWLSANSETARRLLRAVIRGCVFCENPSSRTRLTEMLARPDRIDLPAEIVSASLKLESRQGKRARSTSPAAIFPSRRAAAWMLTEMQRWGHVPAGLNIPDICNRVIEQELYLRAAGDVGVTCPASDDMGSLPEIKPPSAYARPVLGRN